MKKEILVVSMVATLTLLNSCEKEPAECTLCEPEPVSELSEWGEHVKDALISLFIDVEDLALCQVWSADSETRFWSGYGSNGEDSREIQYEFLEKELVLVHKQFVNGKWCNSMIRIPYELVITTVLQYATHVEGGMVVRRANNILIYMSDQFDPDSFQDGVDACCIPPSYLKVTHERLILQKESAPTS